MKRNIVMQFLLFSILFQVCSQNKKPNYNEKIAFTTALDLFHEQKYSYAASLFEDFVFVYQDSKLLTSAYEYLAKTYRKMQFYSYAVEIFQKLIQIGMQTEQGLNYRYKLAKLYLETGRYQLAQKMWQQIIQINSESPIAHRSRLQLKLMLILAE